MPGGVTGGTVTFTLDAGTARTIRGQVQVPSRDDLEITPPLTLEEWKEIILDKEIPLQVVLFEINQVLWNFSSQHQTIIQALRKKPVPKKKDTQGTPVRYVRQGGYNTYVTGWNWSSPEAVLKFGIWNHYFGSGVTELVKILNNYRRSLLLKVRDDDPEAHREKLAEIMHLGSTLWYTLNLPHVLMGTVPREIYNFEVDEDVEFLWRDGRAIERAKNSARRLMVVSGGLFRLRGMESEAFLSSPPLRITELCEGHEIINWMTDNDGVIRYIIRDKQRRAEARKQM